MNHVQFAGVANVSDPVSFSSCCYVYANIAVCVGVKIARAAPNSWCLESLRLPPALRMVQNTCQGTVAVGCKTVAAPGCVLTPGPVAAHGNEHVTRSKLHTDAFSPRVAVHVALEDGATAVQDSRCA